MNLSFKQLTRENYQSAFELQTNCHHYPWSERVFVDCLDGQYFAWQGLLSDQVVGYYVGLQVLHEATLMDIGIAEAVRGRKLGTQVLNHFLQQCEKKDIKDIWLEVRASNIHALALYKRFGFALIETRKDYYPTSTGRENAMIMKRG